MANAETKTLNDARIFIDGDHDFAIYLTAAIRKKQVVPERLPSRFAALCGGVLEAVSARIDILPSSQSGSGV